MLVISFVITTYVVYKIRLNSSNTEENLEKTNDENSSQGTNDDPGGNDEASIYEIVDNEQSSYTALKVRPGEEEKNHVYADLDKVKNDFVYQVETAM